MNLFLSSFFLFSMAQAATEYTGDITEGYPVISKLDVTDLEPGEHKMWFRGAEDAQGRYIDVPVMVTKSDNPGPVFFLQSGVHGDEIAGTQVIQQVFQNLDYTNMTGVMVGIVGANPTGIEMHSRLGYSTTDGGAWDNLNRLMPGSNTSSSALTRFAYTLWNDLYLPSNPDVFLDLHTQSRGTAYPYFVYADLRNEVIAELVQIMPSDVIKDDAGLAGTVETELVTIGVPAMTVELGAPKVFDADMTTRGVQTVYNFMYYLGMAEGEVDMLGIETFFCDDNTSIRANSGGYSEILVELNTDVTEGDPIAIQLDAFGDERESYTAPVSGKVLSVATDPIREPGALLVRICADTMSRSGPGTSSTDEMGSETDPSDDAQQSFPRWSAVAICITLFMLMI